MYSTKHPLRCSIAQWEEKFWIKNCFFSVKVAAAKAEFAELFAAAEVKVLSTRPSALGMSDPGDGPCPPCPCLSVLE